MFSDNYKFIKISLEAINLKKEKNKYISNRIKINLLSHLYVGEFKLKALCS